MKYIIPVSGGKDSQAVLRWAVENHPKEQLVAVHQFTGYDHPATIEHLRYMEDRYGVKIEFTKHERFNDIFEFIKHDKHFPHGSSRGCTRTLKQRPFKFWLRSEGLLDSHIYMGMRSDESASRGSRYGELSPEDKFSLGDLAAIYRVKYLSGVTISLPIVNWSTKDVFDYLGKFADKLNPLYKSGFDRVGCFPCLLGKNKDWELAARDPVGRAHIEKLLDLQSFLRSQNPNKSLKIHPTRDIVGLLERGVSFTEEDNAQCGWCSI